MKTLETKYMFKVSIVYKKFSFLQDQKYGRIEK